MQKKFQQFEDFLFELPSRIESITQVPKKLMEKRNEMITKNLIAKNKMESGDYPKAPIQPKALAILLLPFLPIFIYFFYVFSASIILFVYMVGIMVYFLCLLCMLLPLDLAVANPNLAAQPTSLRNLPSALRGTNLLVRNSLPSSYQPIGKASGIIPRYSLSLFLSHVC